MPSPVHQLKIDILQDKQKIQNTAAVSYSMDPRLPVVMLLTAVYFCTAAVCSTIIDCYCTFVGLMQLMLCSALFVIIISHILDACTTCTEPIFQGS